MSKERLEDLSIEELKKRKKFVLFIIGVCIGISLFSMGFTAFRGRLESISSFVPGLVLLICSGVMYMGGKKIDNELSKRNDK
jgi:hypothetical protein